MASECFDCSPPIPSGRYDIVNKVNGNINLIQQVDPNLAGASYRVVADQEALIWEIEHLEGHDYYISVAPTPPNLGGGPAIDRQGLLYVVSGVQPEVWVICGERNPTAPNESLYLIKKKSPIQVSPSSPSWTLASATPGTQVEVIPPPPAPGLGCEVNRVPAVFTWHIIPRLD